MASIPRPVGQNASVSLSVRQGKDRFQHEDQLTTVLDARSAPTEGKSWLYKVNGRRFEDVSQEHRKETWINWQMYITKGFNVLKSDIFESNQQ